MRCRIEARRLATAERDEIDALLLRVGSNIAEEAAAAAAAASKGAMGEGDSESAGDGVQEEVARAKESAARSILSAMRAGVEKLESSILRCDETLMLLSEF